MCANASKPNRGLYSIALSATALAVLAMGFPGNLLAQDASLMVHFKSQEFYQDDPYSLSLREEEDGEYPLAFVAVVEASSSGALASARIVQSFLHLAEPIS